LASPSHPLSSHILLQFGKQLQAERIPGWSAYYLDYKALKKIISSFSKKGESEAIPQIPEAHTPLSILNQSDSQPPLQTLASADDERGPVFQRHKAFFFFKLERELDKVDNSPMTPSPALTGSQINTFYLQKEAELKLRLETLLSKRQSAAKHIVPSDSPRGAIDHAEWKAVEEGFQIFQRDLDKLQVRATYSNR
jgi:CDK inhibitor PHO81